MRIRTAIATKYLLSTTSFDQSKEQKRDEHRGTRWPGVEPGVPHAISQASRNSSPSVERSISSLRHPYHRLSLVSIHHVKELFSLLSEKPSRRYSGRACFHSSIFSISATALLPFSIAASTSKTLSLQPAIRYTSLRRISSGVVP